MEQEKHNDTKEKESPKETDTQKESEPSKEKESPKEKEAQKEKHHKKHHPPNPNINKIHVCINKKIVDVVIFFSMNKCGVLIKSLQQYPLI